MSDDLKFDAAQWWTAGGQLCARIRAASAPIEHACLAGLQLLVWHALPVPLCVLAPHTVLADATQQCVGPTSECSLQTDAVSAAQSFEFAADDAVLTDEDEMGEPRRPAKVARVGLGPRKASVRSVPEGKALHTEVLQPAWQYMRARMDKQQLTPFLVRAPHLWLIMDSWQVPKWCQSSCSILVNTSADVRRERKTCCRTCVKASMPCTHPAPHVPKS